MLITPSALNLFFTGLSTKFWLAYRNTPIWWQKIAMMFPSSTETELYGWMGKIPTLRQWTGSRELQNPHTRSYSLTNLPFELTLSVDKWKLQDDTYGLYSPMVEMMGWQAAKWPDYEVIKLLTTGGLCADGGQFWATTHPVNYYDSTLSVYSNYSASGLALTTAHYQTVRSTMAAYKGEDGKPLGVMPNVLVVPPALEQIARTIVEASFIGMAAVGPESTTSGTTENVLKGTAQVLVIPELAGNDTTWYLLDTTRPIKPFMWQQRQAPNFVYRVNEQDPAVFERHEYVYGVDARGVAGFAHPWLAYKAVA